MARSGARRPSGLTRRDIVQGVRRELEQAGLASAALEAERLVAAALELSRADLKTGEGRPVDSRAAVRVARAVSRRLDGQPLQHIEGTVDFRRVRLVSDGRALIPRPETEQLVDLIVSWAGAAPVPRALDIGVGSGALALALLDEGVARRVLGLDVSERALEQARENARRSGDEGMELRRCPPGVWSALEPGECFDLIVSNPPYIATDELDGLDPVVRDHEPRVALDGGRDGLSVIRIVIAGAAAALVEGGALFLEIGASQGQAVLALLEAERGLSEARIDLDFTGRTRFAWAIKSAVS